MRKLKFNIGDRVHVIPTPSVFGGEHSVYIGMLGTVDEVVNEDEPRYYVKLDGRSTYALWEDQLETAVLDELARIVE